MLSLFISIILWCFSLVFWAFFYIALFIVKILAHIFGGVFLQAAESMHNKAKNRKKKKGLNNDAKTADMEDILSYVLSTLQPQADARNINLTQTIDKKIMIDVDPQKTADALIALTTACMQLSPVHANVYCIDYGNYIVTGARCMNTNVTGGSLEQISAENATVQKAKDIIQALGTQLNTQTFGNDVTYSFLLNY